MSLFTDYNPTSGMGSFESSNGTSVTQSKEISDRQWSDIIGNIVDSTHAFADAVDYATQTACDVANGTTQYHTRRNIVREQQCCPNQQNNSSDNVIDYSNIPYGYGGQPSRAFNYVNQQTLFGYYNNNSADQQNNNRPVGGIMQAPFGTKIY